MNHNPDEYYNRREVSNSDLTELKNLLHPRQQFGDKEAAFRFGSLVDAIITEPSRVNIYRYTVDDVQYTTDEFELAREMHKSLQMEARKDEFLAKVLELSDTQRFMVNRAQQFEYGSFPFTLDTRCKWDWFLSACNFGGDLKTTFATSQNNLMKPWISSIGIAPAPGTWILPTVISISFMQFLKRTASYSRNILTVVMPYISVDERNMKNWHSNTGVSILQVNNENILPCYRPGSCTNV